MWATLVLLHHYSRGISTLILRFALKSSKELHILANSYTANNFPSNAFGYRISSLICWGYGVDFWRYFYVWIATLAKGLMDAWVFLGIQRRQSAQFPISNKTVTPQIRVLEYTFIYFCTINPVPRITWVVFWKLNTSQTLCEMMIKHHTGSSSISQVILPFLIASLNTNWKLTGLFQLETVLAPPQAPAWRQDALSILQHTHSD